MSLLFDWPVDLLPPEPFDSDYAITPGDLRVRTQMEQGLQRQRLSTDLARDLIQLRWLFDPDSYESFNGTIDSALAGGALWFNIPIFIDEDYAVCVARFVKGSFERRTRMDGWWQVTAQLEVKNLPVMSDSDLTTLIGAAVGTGPQAWPESILNVDPLNDGFAHVISDGLNRDDLPSGDLEQARPFRQMPAIYEWSIPLVNSKFAIYRGFRQWRVKGGRGWFTAPMMRGGDYETQMVRIVAGTERWTRSGGNWIVTAQLEVSDLAPLSAEQTSLRILIAESGFDWAAHGVQLAGLITDYAGALA